MAKEKLVQRADKVAFMDVDGTGKSFERMKGFTSMATNKNPKEYTRQYVDELFETTDVVGISASIDFAFDQFVGNKVHDKLAQMIDDELIGTDAVVEIVIVDFSKPSDAGETTFEARKRNYSVIPATEGDSLDAYTYGGSFKVNGGTVKGTAESTDNWLTATFTEATGTSEG